MLLLKILGPLVLLMKLLPAHAPDKATEDCPSGSVTTLMWETRMEFLAPGVGLAQPCLYGNWEKGPVGDFFFLLLFFSHSPCVSDKQINKK